MIKFYFGYNGQTILLPVNPPVLKIARPGDNKTESMVSIGEINILRDIRLKEFSFESFFPASLAPYVIEGEGGFKEPQFYIDFFNYIRLDKKPVLFTVTDLYNLSMWVSVETFDTESRAGECYDVHYSLKLKEYKKFTAKELEILGPFAEVEAASGSGQTAAQQAKAVAKPKKNSRPVNKKQATSTLIASGDSLMETAKRVYDDMGKYNAILRENDIPDPITIQDGRRVVLPHTGGGGFSDGGGAGRSGAGEWAGPRLG